MSSRRSSTAFDLSLGRSRLDGEIIDRARVAAKALLPRRAAGGSACPLVRFDAPASGRRATLTEPRHDAVRRRLLLAARRRDGEPVAALTLGAVERLVGLQQHRR